MRKKNGIPDRWLAYQNIGHPIPGTRFVAFKVPLAERYIHRLTTLERFGPVQLYDARPDLGLVIDLTNTDRYYSPEFLVQRGVLYHKISCPGRVVPPERVVNTFCNVVHEYISLAPTKGTLIGVHCTHGVNRTGFLICSYMIRQMLVDPREAISVFEAARGHNIERTEYIDALLNLRLDGSIRDGQRLLDDEYFNESGPSSSVGTPSFGQGPRYCITLNTRPELPDGIRSSSHLPAGPSTSARPAWDSVPGPEVNIWPTTSRSSEYTWTSLPAQIPCCASGICRRHASFNNTGYSALPRLNNAGMYVRTHLPHTVARPDTEVNSEPAHSSSAEYGASQRERPIDEFSLPDRTQLNRGLPVLGRCPQQRGAPTPSLLAPPKHRPRLSPPLSSSSHPSSSGRRGGGDGRGRRRGKGNRKRRGGESAFTAHRSSKSSSEQPFVPPKLGQSEK